VGDDRGFSGVWEEQEVGCVVDEASFGEVMEEERADDSALSGIMVDGNEDEMFVFFFHFCQVREGERSVLIVDEAVKEELNEAFDGRVWEAVDAELV